MRSMRILKISAIALLTCSASLPAAAQTKAALDLGVAQTVNQFNLLDPRHASLSAKASGMLIFPQVTKGGIAVASEYGEGALQVGGSIVDYYSVASASVGLTAGLASHSEIVLFMTPEALNRFVNSKGWSIGADTGITVISKGRSDAYDTNTMQKPVLVFLFAEKGLIADLSLQGTKINKISK